MAALYQIAHEEGRGLILRRKNRSTSRQKRNDFIALMILGTDFPLEAQEKLKTARDRYAVGIEIFPELPEPHRETLREILKQAAAL